PALWWDSDNLGAFLLAPPGVIPGYGEHLALITADELRDAHSVGGVAVTPEQRDAILALDPLAAAASPLVLPQRFVSLGFATTVGKGVAFEQSNGQSVVDAADVRTALDHSDVTSSTESPLGQLFLTGVVSWITQGAGAGIQGQTNGSFASIGK